MALSTNQMMSLVFTLVIISVILAMGSKIITNVQDKTNTSYLYNTSKEGLDAFNTFSQFLPSIAIIVVAVIIVGILVMFRA